MLISKWPPGSHIGFFCSPDSNFSLSLNINSKLKSHNAYIYGKEPIDFQRRHFENGRMAAILDFFGFWTKFSLALNINSKVQQNTYVYG